MFKALIKQIKCIRIAVYKNFSFCFVCCVGFFFYSSRKKSISRHFQIINSCKWWLFGVCHFLMFIHFIDRDFPCKYSQFDFVFFFFILELNTPSKGFYSQQQDMGLCSIEYLRQRKKTKCM